MSTFKTFTTISGREIKVRANESMRHFTIVTKSGRYRTYKLSKDEFNSCKNNTGNDWQQYLSSNDYYTVKK